jgi:hypothetical protein
MQYKRISVLVLTLFIASILIAGCGGSSSMKEPVNGTPTLSALSTDNVLVGSPDLTLNLTGSGFVTGVSVSFGSSPLTPTSVTASQLSVVVPKDLLIAANIVSVTVTNPAPGGGISNALQFTIKNPVPTLDSLSANSIVVGSPDLTVTITGNGFVPEAMVHFGSTDLTPTVVTNTNVSFVIPAILLGSVGVVPVAASNPEPGGGISNALNFTVGNPVPTITSFVTSSTLINSTAFLLEIDGQGFVTGTQVHFASDTLTPSAVTPTQLTVPIPDNLLTTARMVPVTVTNPEPIGGTSNSIDFGVHNPVPEITALSIDTVEAGAPQDLAISLTGKNFVGGATVAFGAQQLSPASITADTIEVTIPIGSLATGVQTTITVTNPGPGGGTSNTKAFTVTNPVPVLSALSQENAMAGDPSFDLELIGEKFVPGTTVNFGGVALTPSSVSDKQIIVNIPDSAFATGGVIQISVANPEPGGGVSGAIDFTINNPVPTITSALPTSITNTGSDTTITLSGTNFVTTSTVKAGTDEVKPTKISKTSLQVTLPSTIVAGAVAAGSIPLSVSNPTPSGGPSNTFNLIVHDKAALVWRPLANTSTMVPGLTVPFSIFGSPSVNASGTVVFSGTSALSTSGSGETSATLGIYSVNPTTLAITKVADTATLVPDPNKLTYGSSLAKFGGFPSYASIDQDSPLVAFAATHPPVLQLTDGKAGNAGLYANPSGNLVTGMGLFTQAPYTYFQVPDMPAGTAFDAFPVSSAVVNGSTLVFKGDYLSGTTVAMGIYYRDLTANNGNSNTELIASTVSTLIPGQGVKFGYLAAPSAVGNKVVFVGYNRQASPVAGGIYSAPLATAPTLTPLVTIGTAVPGETATFTRFSDGISFDGRYVGFWGAWGTESTTRHLTCPTDGDQALDAYCLTVFPNGFDAQVPMHQGIFIYDTVTNSLTAVAKTGSGFSDFTYWPFVGSVPEEGPTGPGTGSGEVGVPVEVPAFVLSPHVVVTSASGSYQVAFEASTGPVDGIYMTSAVTPSGIVTVVDTTMSGTSIDLNADPATQIKKLDLEREGLRGSWLTIGSTMQDSATQSTWAGIFAASTSNQP